VEDETCKQLHGAESSLHVNMEQSPLCTLTWSRVPSAR